ncbi:ArdC family protein [Ancylobacter vacuolatus]|jgi:antirestriction protein ArdC|uniref:ArdC family protein n=1 Tax=Ancylobacter vacuolatus TaxID=223389 RepID=UPI00362CA3BF
MAKAKLTTETRTDIYQTVTNAIIAHLEAGTRPWSMPWKVGSTPRPLRHNGVPYSGINTLLLWIEAQARGFSSNYWMTYRQAQELGAQVRKGERSCVVVYAGAIERNEVNNDGEEVETRIPFLKTYNVFNADQIDGLPEHYTAAPVLNVPPAGRYVAADSFVANTGALLRHGGSKAFYSPAIDLIQMPAFEAFIDAESYATTLLHELVHWSGAKPRLNRNFEAKRWGDAGYAAEELVAEIGAAFLAADLDIALEPREDHASYVAHWLKVLKEDKRAIFTAAAHAERAAGYLHGYQSAATEEAA